MTTPIEPHVWTKDLPRAIAWYEGALGFEVRQWFPDPSHPTWVQMGRDDALLMLAAEPEPNGYLASLSARLEGPGPAISLYLHVADSDAAHDRAQEAAADIIEPIWDAWWGGRQFTVADPDGNWWTVFQASDPQPSG